MYNPWGERMIPQGWECPRCHRIYSPTQSYCLFCENNQIYNIDRTIRYNEYTVRNKWNENKNNE